MTVHQSGRRQMFKALGAGLTSLVPMQVALAAANTNNRLVVVLLRGGMDSLDAVVPFADSNYYKLRPSIAIAEPGKAQGALDLNGKFGLHPALTHLHTLYKNQQLLVVPAATTSYRRRSHFDAQNQLENGSEKPFGARDGWLNRTIAAMNSNASDSIERRGLMLGANTPLIMYGDAPIQTWVPSRLPQADDDFLRRVARSYEGDDLLAGAMIEALELREQDPITEMAGNKKRRSNLNTLATRAGQLLAANSGPRIAVFESYGWDTHTGQRRRLTRGLSAIDTMLRNLQESLGAVWSSTVVLVVTEFGRTAAENGSRGTDHGIASMALLAGGAVDGGRLLGDWPGLAPDQLYQGRDLQPTTDYQSIFKALITEHLGVSSSRVEQQIFPGQNIKSLKGLLRQT